ncbi:hypothetical protein RJT34_07111 [Clitoria ternatea]|uniref:F-box domain-containing protein n=1 Tax=Clitoria ternatea TaxID=43366 RepID=A0AAN9K689_CLITE
MTTLPDEIVLYDILPWLPSKSLLRFRCVCKSWHSFITHPSFLHLRRHRTNTHSFLFLSPDPLAPVLAASQPQLFSAPFHHLQPSRPTLLFTLPNLNFSETRVQCVNGLLCFHPKSSTWFSSHVSAFTLIANPTTTQLLALPLDHSIGEQKEFLVSTHFGYDPVRDEFKVLRLIKYHGSHEFKVFTVGVDTLWRVVSVPDRPFALMHTLLHNHKRGLCVNGVIHWTHSFGSILHRLCIVTFDVGTEQCRVIPAPSGYSYRENVTHLEFPNLVEIDGSLCLLGYSGSDLIKLWILKDLQDQVWEQASIALPSGTVTEHQVVYPLCRVSTGEVLLVPYFLPRRVKGIYYDMEKKNSRSVVVMEMPQPLWPNHRGEVDIFFCQESFRILK